MSSNTASQIGIATAAIASAADGTIRLSGRITGLSALTAGEDYYVSATEGALTTTPPTNGRFVGRSDTTTTLVMAGNTPGSLFLPDSDGTHRLVLLTTSNLTADRTFSVLTGDVSRTLSLSGDLTVSVSSTLNQDLTTTSSPTFSALTATTVDTGQGANELYDMDQHVLTTSSTSFNAFRPPQGRCTLTTATPVTTADVTAATTLYYALYGGNQITLYDGSARWVQTSFAQLSIAVPATTDTLYDVFVDYTAGTPALEVVAWTNDTTRATALALQNGVYVQTSDTDSLYVCSFRTTGVSGQTEDSFAKRYVWNYYNRVLRQMRATDGADTWTYTTAVLRQANANTANQLDLVVGVAEDAVTAMTFVMVSNDNAAVNWRTGIGYDSTTATATGAQPSNSESQVASRVLQITSYLRHYPAVGRHIYVWLEYSQATGTTTWYGDAGGPTNSGIVGQFGG